MTPTAVITRRARRSKWVLCPQLFFFWSERGARRTKRRLLERRWYGQPLCDVQRIFWIDPSLSAFCGKSGRLLRGVVYTKKVPKGTQKKNKPGKSINQSIKCFFSFSCGGVGKLLRVIQPRLLHPFVGY